MLNNNSSLLRTVTLVRSGKRFTSFCFLITPVNWVQTIRGLSSQCINVAPSQSFMQPRYIARGSLMSLLKPCFLKYPKEKKIYNQKSNICLLFTQKKTENYSEVNSRTSEFEQIYKKVFQILRIYCSYWDSSPGGPLQPLPLNHHRYIYNTIFRVSQYMLQ